MKHTKTAMKFFIGMLAAVSISFTASAQHGNSPAGHVNIGIKGGLNAYNIHNNNKTTYDPKIGFNVGLLGHIHLNKNFALQPEIVYSAQGAKYKVSNVETIIKLDYVNIPVLFQYMWDNGLRIQAGPQVGLLLSGKSKTNSVTVDNKENLEPIDFAVSFGAGYIHPATGLGIDLRYNLGLTDINKNSTVVSTNRGLQLGLFYIFGKKSKDLLTK